jgi:Tfp pilus assembly protein PilZ
MLLGDQIEDIELRLEVVEQPLKMILQGKVVWEWASLQPKRSTPKGLIS